MKNHRLLKLLESFSKKEMTRLVDFAASPYHNKHIETQQLVQYLASIYPGFSEKKCNRRYVWKKLFRKKPLNQPKLALLFTYVTRLVENFLAIERLEKEPFVNNIWLLETFRDRREEVSYQRQFRVTQKQLVDYSFRDKNFYEASFRFFEEANSYYVQTENRKEDLSLQEKQHALDQFYVMEKLRDAVEMQVRRQIIKGDYSARLMEAVMEEVRSNPEAYVDAPGIQVYFQLNVMMQNPSLPNYRQALRLFFDKEDIFQQKEKGAIYNYFQNYCIAAINRNQTHFLRELFELYRAQLDRGLLSEDGYLVEWHYKNIVTTGIRLGEMIWIGNFIEQYKKALHPDTAENAYRFNKAAYLHAKGNYEEVLPLLIQVEYSDLRYNLGAKTLLLRTYYELNEFDALNALVETFRQYLQRNRRLADVKRGGYYQLFRFTRRAAIIQSSLVYAETSKTKAAINRLRREMQEAEAIFNRAWLEEKIKELERKIN